MSRRYCFTLNNPTDAEKLSLDQLGDSCRYLVLGFEVGESGTPLDRDWETKVSWVLLDQLT